MGFEQHKGEIRLGAGHSLICGHAPQISKLTWNEEEAKTQIGRFGLFNLATPDSISFYKDVTKEDLTPKEDDFIKPLFRGLSETIVRKHTDPIDFGHEKGVLKASMDMMLGQTVFANHEAFVGNEKGVVNDVFWDRGHEADGIIVPAGFNMEFLIDGKIHTKLVRELQAPKPMVHSNSVTVNFGWKQSHPKMDLGEFRMKVGTFDDKGELIRRIVDEIFGYHETSLVAHGADPYAQMIKDGKIVNPKYAHARDSFSEEKKTSTFYGFDWKTSLSEEKTIPDDDNIIENEDKNKENLSMNKELKGLVMLVAALAGIQLTTEEAALSEEQFAEKFDLASFNTKVTEAKLDGKALETLQATVDTLTEEKSTLTTEKGDLQTKLTEAEKFKTDNEAKLALIADAEAFKTSELSEVIRLHELNGGKADDAIGKSFGAATVQTLTAFKKTFSKSLEEKFPSKCGKCGSTEISKASTLAADDDEDDANKPKSFAQIREDARRNGSASDYTGLMHGE